jgi:DNA-binding MarR family transcriptional regulator
VNDLPEHHVPYGAGAGAGPADAGPADAGPTNADRAERDALVDRVVAAYETLMHRVASAHAPEFVGVGVTMSQAKVLYLVQMSDLAGRLGVTLPSISGVVDRLVDQGLLTRRDDPADRRQALVRISDAGIDQLELFRELNARQVRILLARLDMVDLAVIERALDILATAAAADTHAAPAAAGRGELIRSSIAATASPTTTTTGGNPS